MTESIEQASKEYSLLLEKTRNEIQAQKNFLGFIEPKKKQK